MKTWARKRALYSRNLRWAGGPRAVGKGSESSRTGHTVHAGEESWRAVKAVMRTIRTQSKRQPTYTNKTCQTLNELKTKKQAQGLSHTRVNHR